MFVIYEEPLNAPCQSTEAGGRLRVDKTRVLETRRESGLTRKCLEYFCIPAFDSQPAETHWCAVTRREEEDINTGRGPIPNRASNTESTQLSEAVQTWY